jgi:single-strand DNA-binding protein
LEVGVHLAKFTLATLESYKEDKENLRIHTECHNVIVWRSLAEVVGKYLK